MDFPYPPKNYRTSPTAWLAAIAQAAYPPTDWLGTLEVKVTTDTAPASDDHTPCDVITVSRCGERVNLILVTGPDEISLESPGSGAQEQDAAIVWQRRRACLQQQWNRHLPEDEYDDNDQMYGAVLVRGEVVFGEYPYEVDNPSWVNTTDNDAPPVEPWKLSEDEGKARFADSLLRTRQLCSPDARNSVAKWLCAQLGLSFAVWSGIKQD